MKMGLHDTSTKVKGCPRISVILLVEILLFMMTMGNHKLTSLEDRNSYQCYHNNLGYCKFRQNCRYQHYHEVCPTTICKDKKCKFRHPKTCKHGNDCKFYRLKCCLYSHKIFNRNKDLNDIEVIKLEKEVEKLKLEIIKLKNDVFEKEKVIKDNVELDKKLKDMESVNSELLQDNKKKDIKIEEVNNKLDIKNAEIQKMNSAQMCKKCSFQANTLIKMTESIDALKIENKKLKDTNEKLNYKVVARQIKLLKLQEKLEINVKN